MIDHHKGFSVEKNIFLCWISSHKAQISLPLCDCYFSVYQSVNFILFQTISFGQSFLCLFRFVFVSMYLLVYLSRSVSIALSLSICLSLDF